MKGLTPEARADEFWCRAKRTEPFPRMLETTVAWALPLAIVKLPHLWLAGIHLWLNERDIDFEFKGTDRPLRACLLARGGYGLAFIDGSDPDDMQRFSLAHEIAHFLYDYLDPRRRAVEVLGERILPVLDGDRAPSTTEKVEGMLRGVNLGTFQHLMERTASGTIAQIAVLEVEDRADRLALELLAPRQVVLNRLARTGTQWQDPAAFAIAETLLLEEFGLPLTVARPYSRLLVMSRRGPGSFEEWLHR